MQGKSDKNLTNPSEIKEILARYGFNFSKSLGQNFIINDAICPRMAEKCGADDNTGVLEIGPGIGVLTKELARRSKKVVSIELDSKLLPILEETLGAFDNVEIVFGDAMKIDLAALIEDKFSDCERVVVCANLPYYITSPLIMKMLESRLPIDSVTVMIQKEAAVRMSAKLGSRESGAVTLSVWYHSTPAIVFNVSRGSFMPAPNVDSTVITFDLKQSSGVNVADEALMFRLIKSAFNQRRKTLSNSLQGANLSKEQIAAALDVCGISTTSRAEQLSLEQWAKIANTVKKLFFS